MNLRDLAKMVNRATEDKNPAEQFMHDLNQVIQMENQPRPVRPNFKPSMLGGCLRRVYFCVTGVEPDYNLPSPELVGMGESGTDRHDRIQNYVAKMKEKGFQWEWIDVAKFVETRKPTGTRVIEQVGMETKLYNDILDLSFMCDGVIKDTSTGQYYILEIKTEASFKFNTHDGIYDDHEIQGSCYSVALGIDKIIFLYENRDFCSKKVGYVEITDEMKQLNVLDRIEFVNNYVADGKVPPKTVSTNSIILNDRKQCTYCSYKEECKKWGDS